jgi:hypothetical protein
MARRRTVCEALGVGREYRRLVEVTHRRLPEPEPQPTALPTRRNLPQNRMLPAPPGDDDVSTQPQKEEQ